MENTIIWMEKTINFLYEDNIITLLKIQSLCCCVLNVQACKEPSYVKTIVINYLLAAILSYSLIYCTIRDP